MLKKERDEATWKAAEFRRLEGRVNVADTDTNQLCVGHACVYELTVILDSLTTGIEQTKAERGALDDHMRELDVAAATCNGELGVSFRTVGPLNDCIAAAKTSANMGKVKAPGTLERMSRLHLFVEVLTGTIWGESAQVLMVDLEFLRVHLVNADGF